MGNKLRKQNSDKKKAPPIAPETVGVVSAADAKGTVKKVCDVAASRVNNIGPVPGPSQMQPNSPMPLSREPPMPHPFREQLSSKLSSLLPANSVSPLPDDSASSKRTQSSQPPSHASSPLSQPNLHSIPPPPRYKPSLTGAPLPPCTYFL